MQIFEHPVVFVFVILVSIVFCMFLCPNSTCIFYCSPMSFSQNTSNQRQMVIPSTKAARIYYPPSAPYYGQSMVRNCDPKLRNKSQFVQNSCSYPTWSNKDDQTRHDRLKGTPKSSELNGVVNGVSLPAIRFSQIQSLPPPPPRSYAEAVAGAQNNLTNSQESNLVESVANFMRNLQLQSCSPDKMVKHQKPAVKPETTTTPPNGLPVDKWFTSKFLSPTRPAFELLADEFRVLMDETKGNVSMKTFVKPNRAAGPRTIQSKVFTVNGQYIQGYKGRNFIACEGPNRTSVYDFWEMVWQENVGAIIMLNQPYEERLYPNTYNAMHETIQYWPKENEEEMNYAPWHIKCISSKLKSRPEDKTSYGDDETERYTYRLSKISLTEMNPVLQPEPRDILHICHYRWPDGQIPMPLEEEDNNEASTAKILIGFMRQELRNVRGPIVIHCHAGIGRTGVFVAIDIGVSRLLDRQFADVRETVRKIREQRFRAVMNIWQYAYINVTLAQLALDEDMLPKHFMQGTGKNKRKVDSRSVIDQCWKDMKNNMPQCFNEENLLDQTIEENEDLEIEN